MRAVALLCLLLAACGDDDSDSSPGLVSCTISFDTVDGTTVKTCSEMPGSFASHLQQACRSQTVSLPDGGPALEQRAEFVAAPCSRVDALGGCHTTEHGTPTTLWSYAIGAPDSGTRQTSEDIQRLCQEKGREFVPP